MIAQTNIIKLKATIGVKLLRKVFGYYLIVTIVVTSIQIYYEYVNSEKYFTEEVKSVASAFEDALESALWNLDEVAIKSILIGIKKNPIIAAAKVITNEGDQIGAIGFSWNEEEFYTVKSDEEHSKSLNESNFDAVNHDKTKSSKEQNLEHNQDKGRSQPYETDLSQVRIEGRSYYQLAQRLRAKKNDQELGQLFLISEHEIVVERFSESLLLIVLNALIKTVALWLVFIYFSKKILSQPLLDLALASRDLSREHVVSQDLISRIETISVKAKNSELDLLSSNFLTMKYSVLEKISVLNAINRFSIEASHQSKENIFFALTEMFEQTYGKVGVSVFDGDKRILWENGLSIDDKSFLVVYLESNGLDSSAIGGDDENGIVVIENNLPLLAENERCNLIHFYLKANNYIANILIIDKDDLFVDENFSILTSLNFTVNIVKDILLIALGNLYYKKQLLSSNLLLEKRVEERTSELYEMNKKLEHLNLHDHLTGLPNRLLYFDRLSQAIKHSNRTNQRFATVLIDLTKFKRVNDEYGHEVGDRYLVETSKRLLSSIRDVDTISRIGGDEFSAIFMGEGNIESSTVLILQRMIKALSRPFAISETMTLPIKANFGVAIYPRDGLTEKELYKNSDSAMYKAKNNRQDFAFYSSDVSNSR